MFHAVLGKIWQNCVPPGGFTPPLGANYALMHKLHHIQVFVRKCFFVLYYITVFCAQMSD